MLTLTGEKIYLRALEPDDLEFLYLLENDEEFWEVSATSTPYSRFILKQYLENSHRDIFEVKQLRLMICEKEGDRIGFVDLYDFDPRNRRAAIGIVVKSKKNRNKGYGSEAIDLLSQYSFVHLDLHQLYAHVVEDNLSSKLLFEKAGFVKTALKKDWIRVNGSYKNEVLYQLIKENVH